MICFGCVHACLHGIKLYLLLMWKKLLIYYILSFLLWLYFCLCHKYVAFLGWKIKWIILTRLENNIFFGLKGWEKVWKIGKKAGFLELSVSSHPVYAQFRLCFQGYGLTPESDNEWPVRLSWVTHFSPVLLLYRHQSIYLAWKLLGISYKVILGWYANYLFSSKYVRI